MMMMAILPQMSSLESQFASDGDAAETIRPRCSPLQPEELFVRDCDFVQSRSGSRSTSSGWQSRLKREALKIICSIV